MKNRRVLVILTIGFFALAALFLLIDPGADKIGAVGVLSLILGGICFLGLIISLVAGSGKN